MVMSNQITQNILKFKGTNEIQLIGFEKLTDEIYFNLLPSGITISSFSKPSTENNLFFKIDDTNEKIIYSSELIQLYKERGVSGDVEYAYTPPVYIPLESQRLSKEYDC